MNTEKMIKELIEDHKVKPEMLAVKFQVSVSTIRNWAKGDNSPGAIVDKYIEQTLKGYRSAKERKENDV